MDHRIRPGNGHRRASDTLPGIAGEAVFTRMLSLERKRSERTGEPFALMLLNVETLADDGDARVIEKIGIALASATRETDITGWYRRDSEIGVIFTTLNGTDRRTIQSVILGKTYKALSQNIALAQVHKIQISFHFFPEDHQGGTHGANSDRVLYPDFKKKNFSQKVFSGVKRTIDVLGCLSLLLLLSPVFLLIALLIRMGSEGPVFFRQRRVGQFGKEFTFLKFRSMYVNCDSAIHMDYIRDLIDKKVTGTDGAYKIKDDPRVTPVGRFLRKSSLDELPQLINVLKGEMSLVGPRPAIPYEIECYELWHRRRIHQAKPGITGLWQVDGRSRTTFDEMVRLDLRYIQNQSLWLDLKILLKTPGAVFSGNGAY